MRELTHTDTRHIDHHDYGLIADEPPRVRPDKEPSAEWLRRYIELVLGIRAGRCRPQLIQRHTAPELYKQFTQAPRSPEVGSYRVLMLRRQRLGASLEVAAVLAGRRRSSFLTLRMDLHWGGKWIATHLFIP